MPKPALAPHLSCCADPCDNVFGAHPAVISVAASDTHDQATAFGPRNSTCISLWAPSAGLGGGLVGASAEGPANYTRVIDRCVAGLLWWSWDLVPV